MAIKDIAENRLLYRGNACGRNYTVLHRKKQLGQAADAAVAARLAHERIVK